MSGLESAALRAGNTVVQHLARSWLSGKKAELRRGFELTDLLALRFGAVPFRRRNDLRRKLEEIGESAGESLQHLCEREFPALTDGERAGALGAVVDALEDADLSDSTLLRADLDPIALAQEVRTQVPSATRRAGVGEAGRALFDLALDQACVQLVHLVRELPEFDSRLAEESLRRASAVLAGIGQVLDRLPITNLDAPSGTDHDDQFARRYLDLVARHYDALELIGVSVRNFRPRTTLSVAYLSLAVTEETARARRHEEPHDHNHMVVPTLRQERPYRRMRVEPALSGAKRSLVRGDAGTGKSTLLRWLAVAAARRKFTGQLSEWNGCTPFLINLRSYAGKQLPRPEELLLDPGAPFANPVPEGWIHRQLATGKALLLVDGVDELAESERTSVRTWLGSLLRAYPEVRMVVTARPLAASPRWLEIEGFEALSLQRMHGDDIKRFAQSWHRALLDAATSPASLPFSGEEIERHNRLLLNHLQTHEHLRNLASNPLMCAMICALHLDRGGNLPWDRNGLYEAALEMLLDRRDSDRDIPSARSVQLRYADKLVLLQAIAWWLSLEDRSELDYNQAVELAKRTIARIPNNTISASDALDHLLERSGVIRTPAEGKVDFVHRTFQEFLSAREAAEAGHINLLVERSGYDQWTETIIMASALLNRKLREELIAELLGDGKGKSGPRQQGLAVACKEAATDLPPALLTKIERAMRSLAPPRNQTQATQLATLGEPVLKYLPRSLERLNDEQAALCILTAAMVGGDDALTLLRGYAQDRRLAVHWALLNAWRFFDTNQYAETILQHLDLPASALVITEPSHLAHLSKIQGSTPVVADLRGHELTDLHALDPVRNLQEVRLNLSGDADMAPLRRHSGLTRITVKTVVPITNVETLAQLADLYEFRLDNTSTIDDISFVTELSHLDILSLGELRHVDDYSPLRQLTNLRWLELLGCTHLTSLDDLTHMDRLTRLALTDCPIEELTESIPHHFPHLRSLVLNRTRTTQLTPLQTLPLEELRLDDCPIRDLSPLTDLPNLTELRISGCSQIDSLDSVGRIPELKYLDVSHISPEVDLSPLTTLQRVTIRMNSGQERQNGRRLRFLSTKIEYV